MKDILILVEILVSLLLSICVLLQAKGTGFGVSLGNNMGSYSTKRGLEKIVFACTIVLAVLFSIISLSLLFF